MGFIQLLFKINRETQWKTIVISTSKYFLQTQRISWNFFDNKMLINSIPYYKNLTEMQSTNQWQKKKSKKSLQHYIITWWFYNRVCQQEQERDCSSETILSQQGSQRY